MKYDLNLLLDYVDRGLVVMQNHPTLPLFICNYSRECQYNGKWDGTTLNCRGIILDIEGNVVAKTFPKFFNWDEHIAEESKLPPIPNEPFELYMKMDGSLGIIFYYERKLSLEERYNIWFNKNYETGMERFFDPNNLPDFDDPYYEPTPTTKGEWHIASKGSFTSEQAIKGKELLDKLPLDNLDKNNTYLVEIIAIWNRIVVDYGDYEGLVLLGAYNRETGIEVERKELEKLEGWEVVMKYKTWGEDWETLKREISKDTEGYVVRFQSGFRMKLKGDEYLRLHRIVTNFSTRSIWEILMYGEDLEPFLERVPDEFDTWVKEVVKDLQTRYDNIRNDYAEITIDLMNKVGFEDKKAFAELALLYPHNSILFSMYNGKLDCMNEYIWKLLKPKYEKAFSSDESI